MYREEGRKEGKEGKESFCWGWIWTLRVKVKEFESSRVVDRLLQNPKLMSFHVTTFLFSFFFPWGYSRSDGNAEIQ